MVGKKGSGKTTLFLKLLLDERGYCKKYDRIVFFSPTFKAQYAKTWSKLSSTGITVYEEVEIALLQQLMEEQLGSEKNLLVVFDDVSEILRHLDPQTINKFISNSRHMNLSCVFLCQKLTQLSTCIRCNTDVYVCFAAMAEIEISSLFREVSVVNKQQFVKMFRHVTMTPYAFMAIRILNGKIEFFENFQKRIEIE